MTIFTSFFIFLSSSILQTYFRFYRIFVMLLFSFYCLNPCIMTFFAKLRATAWNSIVLVSQSLNPTDQWHFLFMKNQFFWKTLQIKSFTALSKVFITKLFLFFLLGCCLFCSWYKYRAKDFRSSCHRENKLTVIFLGCFLVKMGSGKATCKHSKSFPSSKRKY